MGSKTRPGSNLGIQRVPFLVLRGLLGNPNPKKKHKRGLLLVLEDLGFKGLGGASPSCGESIRKRMGVWGLVYTPASNHTSEGDWGLGLRA